MNGGELFVFAGAGVSHSPPAALPMFNSLRDEILDQLGLRKYVRGAPESDPALIEVAAGLAPEAFMLNLLVAGVELYRWLGEVLVGRPNAAHHALAQLAIAGARVWTVNFDCLIERAQPELDVLAWPALPERPAQLTKPHGTLGGDLIVGADQVLRGLEEAWRARLQEDVAGRTVLFVGYSGRDLDFQPVWDSVLSDAGDVLWFEQPDLALPAHVEDEERRRLLLRDTDARGALRFVVAGEDPAAANGQTEPNSGAEFVRWCVDQGLVQFDDSTLLPAMYRQPPGIEYPPLVGDLARARASMLEHLGDYRTAQRQRLHRLRYPRLCTRAVRDLLESSVNHGTRLGRVLLLGAKALPRADRYTDTRERAERKRLTALHREAHHEAVIRSTPGLDQTSLSTLLILRACALRSLSSLDEAAELADDALRRARREEHAVRTAHAAFQKALALLWAERVTEARRCLEDELRPYASLASNRWVAWSHFVEGGLLVRGGQADAAVRAYDMSETLFAAEALMDGIVSARVARLTARRLAGDDDAFAREAARLAEPPAMRRDWRWYAQRSGITAVALELERAEFSRRHLNDALRARTGFARVARTQWPLYACLGELGMALASEDNASVLFYARRAQDTALTIGARLVSSRTEELLAGGSEALREVFFC